jgi:hypothetical protein
LTVLAQIIEGALAVLPTVVPNMLAVLGAALLSVVAVSFFRAEKTVFTNAYVLLIFAGGTLSPFLGLAAGIAIFFRAHRKQEWDQRELSVLFTLLLFCIAYWYGLVGIPQLTLAS